METKDIVVLCLIIGFLSIAGFIYHDAIDTAKENREKACERINLTTLNSTLDFSDVVGEQGNATRTEKCTTLTVNSSWECAPSPYTLDPKRLNITLEYDGEEGIPLELQTYYNNISVNGKYLYIEGDYVNPYNFELGIKSNKNLPFCFEFLNAPEKVFVDNTSYKIEVYAMDNHENLESTTNITLLT